MLHGSVQYGCPQFMGGQNFTRAPLVNRLYNYASPKSSFFFPYGN
jgi:hypothetical protein